MSNIILGSEVSVLDGDSLDLVLQNIKNDVNALMGPTRFTLYTETSQLTELGLNVNTMTLKQLALAMPLYSSLVLAVGNNQPYASTLPLPYITQVSSPIYMSGVITIDTIGGDYRRVNFTFRNRDLVATCSYFEYDGTSVSPWVFQTASQLNRQFTIASQWGNLISNIWMPGVYYFNGTEIAKFTDLPSGWTGGSYIEVINKDNVPTGDIAYTLRLNASPAKIAYRSKNGTWYSATLSAI